MYKVIQKSEKTNWTNKTLSFLMHIYYLLVNAIYKSKKWRLKVGECGE